MLLTLLVWGYIFFLSFNLGFLFFKIANLSGRKPIPVELYSLTGLPVLMVLLNYFSFFSGISLVPNFVLLAVSTGAFLLYYPFNKQMTVIGGGIWFWITSLLFFVFILIQALKTPYVTDTGLYHAQTIQWFEKYKVVKGLANLHGRLGFNSSYHLAVALFSFTDLLGFSLHNTLPSYLFLIFSVFALRGIFNENKSTFDPYYFSGSLLFVLIFYRPWISSPSPDFPATIYLLLVFYFLFKWMETSDRTLLYWIPVVTFVLLIVKLSTIVVLAIPLFMLLKQDKKPRLNFLVFLLAAFLVIMSPWLIRNIIITGYLIYPFPELDIFDLKWKVPYDLVLQEKEWVKSFSRAYTYDWKWVKKISFGKWFPIWWDVKTIVEKVIFISLVFSPVIVFADFVKHKNRKHQFLRTIYLLSFSGVIYWFYMAPYFRFAHGFIIVSFLVSAYLLFTKFKYWSGKGGCLIVILFLVYSIYERAVNINIWNLILKPQPYREVRVKVFNRQGFMLYVPQKDDLCWNHPIPCSPYNNPSLKKIGKTLGEGFYLQEGQ